MTTANTANILRVPGRWIKNPTDLTIASPFGGTELGILRDMVFKPGIETDRPVAEEFGVPVSAMLIKELAVMAGTLRTWDNDLIGSVFPNVATSTQGDVTIVGQVSGSGNRAGMDMATLGFKLLFAPQAIDHHPFVLFYNAVPVFDETLELQLSIAEEFGLSLVFEAQPDSQGRTYKSGLRDNITL